MAFRIVVPGDVRRAFAPALSSLLVIAAACSSKPSTGSGGSASTSSGSGEGGATSSGGGGGHGGAGPTSSASGQSTSSGASVSGSGGASSTSSAGSGGDTSGSGGTTAVSSSSGGFDCTGSTPPCTGPLVWAKGYGNPGNQEGLSLAVDSLGAVIVGGYSDHAIDYGCGSLPTAAGETPTLVKLDTDGNCVWSKVFTTTVPSLANEVLGVAVGPGNSLYIVVAFYGTVDFGGGPVTAKGTPDFVVAKYSSAGTFQWAHHVGSAGQTAGYAVVVDAAGNVVVGGAFSGTADFGGTSLTCGGSVCAFVAKLSSSGALTWAKGYGTESVQVAQAVALDPSGAILLTGANGGTADFGCGALVSAGQSDAFVTKLTPAGACVWSKGYGDIETQAGHGIAADAQGNVLVTGRFDGTVDFGGGPKTSLGGDDIFLLKLDQAGNHLWSKAVGGTGNDDGYVVTVDGVGNVVMAGAMGSATDFGGGTVAAFGGSDIFAAKYDPSGTFLWAHGFGDPSNQYAVGAALDGAGNVFLTGLTSGPIDFGAGAVAGFGLEDAYVVKLAP